MVRLVQTRNYTGDFQTATIEHPRFEKEICDGLVHIVTKHSLMHIDLSNTGLTFEII